MTIHKNVIVGNSRRKYFAGMRILGPAMKVVNAPFVYFLSLFVPGVERQRWQIWRSNMEEGKGTHETGPKMLPLFNSAQF